MYPNFRKLFALYKNSHRSLIISQVLLLGAVIMNLAILALNGRLVNEGVQPGNIDVVINTAIWMVGLTLLQTIFTIGNSFYAVMFAEGTANFLRVYAYRHVQRLSFGNLDRYRTSDMLTRLTADILNVKQAILYGFMLVMQAPFTIIVAALMALLIAPNLLWVMVAVMVVVGAVLLLLIRGLDKLYVARQLKLDQVNSVLQEDLAGIRVVKAFVRQDYEQQRFAATSNDYRAASLATVYRIAAFGPTLMGLLYGSIAVLYYVGGRQVMVTQTLSLGDVVVFSQVLANSLAPLGMLAFIIPFFEAGEASLGRIYEVLREIPEIQDKASSTPLDPASVKGRVVFENASFGYRGKDGQPLGLALKNINLTVEPGEAVGFLGATGSGKSSLVNLIPRFYDVTAGRVTIDGVNVRDIPQQQLRQLVSVALQEAVLFTGTVRTNLIIGDLTADDDDMETAATAADADGFIRQIPEAYDARVARRGANFSGGQRQRMSIARAIVPKPKILILDDSTSAVDLETEARIQASINALMGSTTKFYVAQRISTVLGLDKIVLLDHGEQVAVGSHEELLQSSPLYRQIYESQLGKLEDQVDLAQSLSGNDKSAGQMSNLVSATGAA